MKSEEIVLSIFNRTSREMFCRAIIENNHLAIYVEEHPKPEGDKYFEIREGSQRTIPTDDKKVIVA